MIGSSAADEMAASEAAGASEVEALRGASELEISVNGKLRTVEVEPRTTLLQALRTHMEPPLTGTKEVCGMGSCGACTVLIDGQPAYSCLTLAATCAGRPITTVEGFGSPDAMSDVQQAFCDKDGMMCGFCTPGFVVATHAALERAPEADLDELKYQLSGNLCRCGTYPHVFEAAQAVQEDRARGGEGR
ncbi:(2Fe-2S)-binding protein [Planctomycetota bacterium]|nr:(2Fe-2S)-binding protein [Planctomycetota bacterium]